MTTNIQYVHMPTSESLSKIIINKLEKLHHKFNWVIRAEVFLKKENNASGKNDICEIELSAPGPKFFATSMEDNFEKAVASKVKELERQLKRRKNSFANH
ncbi:ribosome-associated translation inhibitor RaiA [Aurantibacter crassamenti]|uniref:HPF/RaiA family ribosome-associated protein n=1 Tax=Aurantibacter crassamenti TaxID=1837375 RepID=UPI0019397263|nr:HPF/RaiA family ribosome-associated protein [Aurantibacter crassamenti]MBM1106573.1 ribosome-associated translation inhibitor RaiA [Aurantibacter crassamenti]